MRVLRTFLALSLGSLGLYFRVLAPIGAKGCPINFSDFLLVVVLQTAALSFLTFYAFALMSLRERFPKIEPLSFSLIGSLSADDVFWASTVVRGLSAPSWSTSVATVLRFMSIG